MKGKKLLRYACLFTLISMLGIVPLCAAETSPDQTNQTDKTTIEDVQQKTDELLHTLKSYTADQRDEAMQKTKTALDDMDKRIDALETKMYNNWDKMDKAAREKSQASLKTLRQQRTKVAEWYGSMKNSSVGAWGHMKEGFSDAYKSLHEAWEKSEKEFSSNK
jgi:hypothetical protein